MFNPMPKTRREVLVMIAERREANRQYGESDGRVTEIDFLQDLLETMPKPSPARAPLRKPKRQPDYRFSVHYIDAYGHRRSRMYVTREAFDRFLDTARDKGYEVIAYG